MRNLQEGDPARYHLVAAQGLEIAVHKSVAPKPTAFSPRTTDWLKGELKIVAPFIPPTSDRGWGFGEVFEPTENTEWVIFKAKLPQVEDIVNDQGAYAVSASLSLLLENLNSSEQNSTAKNPQYSEVQLANHAPTREDPWPKNPVYVTLFRPLITWAKNHKEDQMKNQVLEAMRNILITTRPRDYHDFEFDLDFKKDDSGLVSLDAPGNACGFDGFIDKKHQILPNTEGLPLSQRIKTTETYKLRVHNPDYVLSQLILLTGFARLEELATGGYFRE